MGIKCTHYLMDGWIFTGDALQELNAIDDEKDYSYNRTNFAYICDFDADTFAVFGKVLAQSNEYGGFEVIPVNSEGFDINEYMRCSAQFGTYFGISLATFLEKHNLSQTHNTYLFTVWS